MILICGRNEQLARQIRRIPGPKPMFVEGFTDNVDSYMSISDFFIGKPGPGSVSEALHFNLPVIVERNGKTLPQERYNTDWIRENEVGIVLKNFGEIESALCDLLSNGQLERFQVNAAAHQNCAVFEAADILGRLMPAGNLSDEFRQQAVVAAH
jgi:UDP-N-acetylglucosamine:LPS N-acetylglucosamine transferase